jgi:hypothetical protein
MKLPAMKSALLCCVLLIQCHSLATAANGTDSIPKKDSSEIKKRYFELSLGQSLLFISESRLAEIRNQASIVVPTAAILIFAEFRPIKRVRIPVFANLPKESKQFIVNNQIVSERASPTFGAGLQVKIFQVPIGKKSKVEFEAGPLASVLWDQNDQLRFAPIIAGRFRFLKSQDFVIYMGSSYSIGVDAVGVLFGTGYIF